MPNIGEGLECMIRRGVTAAFSMHGGIGGHLIILKIDHTPKSSVHRVVFISWVNIFVG